MVANETGAGITSSYGHQYNPTDGAANSYYFDMKSRFSRQHIVTTTLSGQTMSLHWSGAFPRKCKR